MIEWVVERLVNHGVDELILSLGYKSDAFLDAYLEAAGDAVLASVGCYQLEGLGSHLFSAIEGDYFATLGLPLLPLLGALRTHGGLIG